MKNREKYREEIVKAIKDGNSCDFMIETVNTLYSDGWECNDELCQRDECEACLKLFAFWLDEEYEEPPTDWGNVPVDTLVRVRDDENGEWLLRYFCEWNGDMDRKYSTFPNGRSSKTATYYIENWRFCELVEDAADEK